MMHYPEKLVLFFLKIISYTGKVGHSDYMLVYAIFGLFLPYLPADCKCNLSTKSLTIRIIFIGYTVMFSRVVG